VCILLEFCANGSLFDCIHKQRIKFTDRLQWQIAREVAVGLAVLHAMKPPIIHRDIKSLNILLDDNFTAKVRGRGGGTDGA
jgi:serine/threonine protein kinase